MKRNINVIYINEGTLRVYWKLNGKYFCFWNLLGKLVVVVFLCLGKLGFWRNENKYS